MSMKAQRIRESRSSNEESFEALNENTERSDSHKSRPSGSSDFDNINERKVEEVQTSEQYNQRRSNAEQEIETLQKLLIEGQKSVEEKLQILKSEYQEQQKQIMSLRAERAQLRKQVSELEENAKFYKEQYEKVKSRIEQQSHVSTSSLHKVQGSPEKDFTKKQPLIDFANLVEDPHKEIRDYEFKVHSLQTKLDFMMDEDKKIREFLLKALKFNPSFPMQLSTLVESAVIQLDSNLKEVNREIENIILESHLGNSNKILARRQTMEEQKYNHWEVLSNLDVIKQYIGETYRSK